MGEYAKYKGREIKIGTCEVMYYLRYEDRGKVQKLSGSLDAGREKNLFWRLPFPDEDQVEPGSYQPYNRGARLSREGSPYSNRTLAEHPGIIQIHHESGILLNLPCYHGEKLPDLGPNVKTFWTGKSGAYEVRYVKNTPEGVFPVIQCRHCNQMWSMEWDEVLPYVTDGELRARLDVEHHALSSSAAEALMKKVSR